MISPGFFSFFNAQRGLLASQMALNTVNHNIANANTEGYSRQRVNLEAFHPYTAPSSNTQDVRSGQLGQGVTVESVTRVRDTFIDGQFRLENSILGMNTNIRNSLQQLEGILGEPSNAGINGSLQGFFDAAQELSLNPESIAVRQDFLQHAVDLVTIFQQQGNQLAGLQRNLVGDPAVPGSFDISQLAIHVGDANNKLEEIAALNSEILTVLASGAQPNDLFDRRDVLLDELSKIVDISAVETPNGQVTVRIAGQLMVRGVTLVDTLEVIPNPGPVPDQDTQPSLVQTVNGGFDIINNAAPDTITYGTIKGIVEVAGRSTTQTTVRGILEKLDLLLGTIATEINNLHLSGRDLNGNVPAAGDPVFELVAGPGLDIFNYRVDPDLLNDPRLLAAAEGPPAPYLGTGDGENALAMAQLRDGAFAPLGNSGFVDFFNGVISRLGIDTRTFRNRSDNQEIVISSLDLRRKSISGVNMDEELVDLVRFQRAFEASSRAIKTFNEITQTIINMV